VPLCIPKVPIQDFRPWHDIPEEYSPIGLSTGVLGSGVRPELRHDGRQLHQAAGNNSKVVKSSIPALTVYLGSKIYTISRLI
jgi:hypothetical protein